MRPTDVHTDLTQERLKSLLSYDPETGALTWINKVGVRSGSMAGATRDDGYRKVRLNGRAYLAHRLAWLYMTGEYPSRVDHINGDKADNRWVNLRLATASQNAANRSAPANNTSGVKGVVWWKAGQIWRAFIRKDGKLNYLGSFQTRDEAAQAYADAARRLFGSYARMA